MGSSAVAKAGWLVVAWALAACPAPARELLDIATMAIAIDADGLVSRSYYPSGEAPGFALDGDPATKYFNFGGAGTGIIIPGSTASVVRSLQITTANDVPGRDPLVYTLYGTTDPITSADNSTGSNEAWSLIAAGLFATDDARQTPLPPVNLVNDAAYTSYRVDFPVLRDSSGMFQAAEIGLFDAFDATGTRIVGSPALAINNRWESGFPSAEGPSNLFDDDPNTKYLNVGKTNAGVIVTPAVPGRVATMILTTANDAPERDPTRYELYGTNDPVVSGQNSDGRGESWTLLGAGGLDLPMARYASAAVTVNAAEAYTSYKVVFPTVRNAAAANSLQIAGLQFLTPAERRAWSADGLAEGGSGSWTETAATWRSGGAASGWDPASQAVFAGVGGTVAVDAAVAVEQGISFEADGYRLAEGAITLAGSAAVINEITVADGVAARIDSTLISPTGLAKTGPGRLVIGGANALAGQVTVSAGTIEAAHETALGTAGVFVRPGATLAVTAGTSLRSPAVTLDGGTLAAETLVVDSTAGIATLTVGAGGGLTGLPAVTVADGGRLVLAANASQRLAIGSLSLDEVGGRGLVDLSTAALAIDADGRASRSFYLPSEGPGFSLDGDPNTKYMNFGGAGSGIIIPGSSSSVVRSLQITTANDVPQRDPTRFTLYGTDGAIMSLDNSTGDAEAWTLIASGTLGIDDARLMPLPAVNLDNSTAYTSYRVDFPELRDNSTVFQAAEIALFDAADATGGRIVGGPALAIHGVWASQYPGGEGPAAALDGDPTTKYLNFGRANTGIILTPATPGSVGAIVITTANDAPERDPASYALYGTNDPIASGDNSDGGGESWTLVSSGGLGLPTDRLAPAAIPIGATETYTSYKLVFPTLRDADAANSMQVADVQLVEGAVGGLIDLGAGGLTVAAGGISAADLRADILAGRGGGGWDGIWGITSSVAAESNGTQAVGYVVHADGSAEVAVAAMGDTDLDGSVNVFDLVGIRTAGVYGTAAAGDWSQGDFNYDGVTNVLDLIGIFTGGGYGQGSSLVAVAGSGSAPNPAAVPEPACWGAAVGACIAALACRRGWNRRS